MVRIVMGIPELLWGVLKRKGYSSVEDMAWQESQRLHKRIPIATLRSWMTKNRRYRRQPWKATSLRLISDITGEPLDRLFEMVEAGAHDEGDGSHD